MRIILTDDISYEHTLGSYVPSCIGVYRPRLGGLKLVIYLDGNLGRKLFSINFICCEAVDYFYDHFYRFIKPQFVWFNYRELNNLILDFRELIFEARAIDNCKKEEQKHEN